MIPAVPTRPVPVSPPVVCGKEIGEQPDEILIAARPSFHDSYAGRGVGDEHREEAVGLVLHEPVAIPGDIEDSRAGAGDRVYDFAAHRRIFTPRGAV
jgi:hypothetical protein